VLKSIDDLPKPSMSLDEIRKTGRIRVIGESARKQEQFNALTAARAVAQRNILSIVHGSKIESETLISKGDLSRDEVKLLIDGNIRTYDCGAFYDRALEVAYYCAEVPVR